MVELESRHRAAAAAPGAGGGRAALRSSPSSGSSPSSSARATWPSTSPSGRGRGWPASSPRPPAGMLERMGTLAAELWRAAADAFIDRDPDAPATRSRRPTTRSTTSTPPSRASSCRAACRPASPPTPPSWPGSTSASATMPCTSPTGSLAPSPDAPRTTSGREAADCRHGTTSLLQLQPRAERHRLRAHRGRPRPAGPPAPSRRCRPSCGIPTATRADDHDRERHGLGHRAPSSCCVVGAGIYGWNQVDITAEEVTWPGWIFPVALVAFGVAMVTCFKPDLARFTAPVYALLQGTVPGRHLRALQRRVGRHRAAGRRASPSACSP